MRKVQETEEESPNELMQIRHPKIAERSLFVYERNLTRVERGEIPRSCLDQQKVPEDMTDV